MDSSTSEDDETKTTDEEEEDTDADVPLLPLEEPWIMPTLRYLRLLGLLPCILFDLMFTHIFLVSIPGLPEMTTDDIGSAYASLWVYVEPLMTYFSSRCNIYVVLFPIYVFLMSLVDFPNPLREQAELNYDGLHRENAYEVNSELENESCVNSELENESEINSELENEFWVNSELENESEDSELENEYECISENENEISSQQEVKTSLKGNNIELDSCEDEFLDRSPILLNVLCKSHTNMGERNDQVPELSGNDNVEGNRTASEDPSHSCKYPEGENPHKVELFEDEISAGSSPFGKILSSSCNLTLEHKSHQLHVSETESLEGSACIKEATTSKIQLLRHGKGDNDIPELDNKFENIYYDETSSTDNENEAANQVNPSKILSETHLQIGPRERKYKRMVSVCSLYVNKDGGISSDECGGGNMNNNGNILAGSYDEDHVKAIDEENIIESSYSLNDLSEDYSPQSTSETEDEEAIEITYAVCSSDKNRGKASSSQTTAAAKCVIIDVEDNTDQPLHDDDKRTSADETTKHVTQKWNQNNTTDENMSHFVKHNSGHEGQQCQDLNSNLCSHSDASDTASEDGLTTDPYAGDLSRGYTTSPLYSFDKAESSGDNSFFNVSLHQSTMSMPSTQTPSGDSSVALILNGCHNTVQNPLWQQDGAQQQQQQQQQQHPFIPGKIQMMAKRINESSVYLERADRSEKGWPMSVEEFESKYKRYMQVGEFTYFEMYTNTNDVPIPRVEKVTDEKQQQDYVAIPMVNSASNWCVRLSDEDYAKLYGSANAQFVIPKYSLNCNGAMEYQ